MTTKPVTINPFTGQPNVRSTTAAAATTAPAPAPAATTAAAADTRAAPPAPASTTAAAADTRAAPTEDPATTEIRDLMERARQLKAEREDITAEYYLVRSQLWDAVGRRPGKIPGGGSFRSAPPRRKVDYTVLAQEFPEAYEAAVTMVETDTDAPGRLFL